MAETRSRVNAPAKSAPAKTQGAELIRKAVRVLDVVGGARSGLSVAEIAKAADLARPTAHRILAALSEEGFLRTDGQTGVLRLGPRFLELAHQSWDQFDLRSAAFGELESLAATAGEGARLMVREGERMLCIETAESRRPGTRGTYGVGFTEPVAASAAGDAVRAFALDGRPLPDGAPHGPRAVAEGADDADAARRLDLARARYYAIDDGIHEPGTRSVAAPVFDQHGAAVAAIVVTGPAHRLTPEALHELGPHVIEAARQTSRAAGGYPFMLQPAAPADAPASPDCEVLVEAHALIGDSPRLADGRLTWIDILAPALHVTDLASRADAVFPLPELVGAAIPEPDGTVTLGFASTLARFEPEDGRIVPYPSPLDLRPGHRVNDGARDPAGRLWLGVMDTGIAEGSGSLVRCAPTGEIDHVLDGWSLPNGIGWSPDGGTMYVTDSARRGLFAVDYDAAKGLPRGAPRLFASPASERVRPASLAVDGAGRIWTCLWDGWAAVRYRPDGTLDASIALPVPRPSGCTAEGDTLYVTSARARLVQPDLRRAPLSGALFKARVP